jgi:YD repeat-containing protein
MDEYVRLQPDERVPGRAFADPAQSAADLAALRTMAARLRRLLEEPAAGRIVEDREPDGRQHRVVLGAADRLGAVRDLGLVGFFAVKRVGLDHAALTRTDDELIEELPGHPGILSYSSLELADGNWGNLIVLDPPEAGERWRTSGKHAWAASELAPRHYTVVRLHNGRLPGGLRSGRDPVLTRTRYHDFRGPAPWRAERAAPAP